MAAYSTFFVSTFKDLGDGFPYWKPPQKRPASRVFVNPFTQTSYSLSSRIPDWTDDEMRAAAQARPKVVAVRGDYPKYLEARLAPFARSCPHHCSKGILQEDVEDLLALVLPEEEITLDVALYSPPKQGACIYAIPEKLVVFLKKSSPAEREAFSVDDTLWSSVAVPIRELAEERKRGQRVFLLVEP